MPPEVRELVHGPVMTMAHVEALLRLRAMAPAPERIERLTASTQASPPATGHRLVAELVDAGLLERVDAAQVRYAPRDPELAAAVDALAVMYNERPVTLVRALYSRPARDAARGDA